MRKHNQVIASVVLVAGLAVGPACATHQGMKTKAQLAEVLAGVGDLYVGGSLPLTPTTLIAQDALVSAEASGRAELTSGRVYEPHTAWVFRVEQGLIVEIKEFIDTRHSYEVFLAP